jgi:Protein of unknown function (DUF2867)
MTPTETLPAETCRPVLPGADFMDAFVLPLPDAPTATARAFAGMPGWAFRLLKLRNLIVSPLGLKTEAQADCPRFGMFPVVLSTSDRVVLGFDDWHLNFRIVVDVDAGRSVTLTTLVKRNNWLGRLYLAVVMPFHKRIVPATLARVAPR